VSGRDRGVESDIYHDPVGDRLRAHDERMREVRWVNAKEILIVACFCLAVVGVAWAVAWTLVSNKPRFATGFTTVAGTVTTSVPWCETRDERVCPVYGPNGTVLGR
jgi:hypothetical protein